MTALRAFDGDLEDLMPHCHARVAAPEIARFRHNDPFRQSLWSSLASFGAHLIDLQPFWQRVRARAGLKDARIHDLRDTFASAAVTAGQGLPMIGKLLGHTQVQTTARYAPWVIYGTSPVAGSSTYSRSGSGRELALA